LALPKKNRIATKKEIDQVFRSGRTVKGSFLFIRFTGNQAGCSRFAFIVSARNVPLAVDRNRVKRMFSEEVMKDRDSLKKEHDIVVTVFKKIGENQFQHLAEELKEVLLKIQI